MKKKANPVTAEDADRFQGYIEKWQALLNLGDWRLVRSATLARKSMAEVLVQDFGQRLATYKIGADFGATPITDHSLEETAIHELCHVFLYPLIEAAKDPKTTTEQLDTLEHSVINVLERLLGARKTA